MSFVYLAGQLSLCTCTRRRHTCTPLFLSCLWLNGHLDRMPLPASGMRSNTQKTRKILLSLCKWAGIVLKVKKKVYYLTCWWVILNGKLMLLWTHWFFESLSRDQMFPHCSKSCASYSFSSVTFRLTSTLFPPPSVRLFWLPSPM